MALPAMVNFSLTFRTHYRTDWGQTVAILGNCQELGNGNTIGQGNKLTWKGNNVWEKKIRIHMARDKRLSFKLVICDDENNQLRQEETNREVNFDQGANLNETLFKLETNWDQPEVRLFPKVATQSVSILIYAEYKRGPNEPEPEKLLVLGNYVRLDNVDHNEMNFIQCDLAKGISKWRLKVTLQMTLIDDRWKLPETGPNGEFKPLSLRLMAIRKDEQIKLEEDQFEPNLAIIEEFRNKFKLQCTFNHSLILSPYKRWVCIPMPIETCLILRDSILTLLLNILKVHLPDPNNTYENVKNKYAQCLVPKIKLDGGYDGRTSRTSGAPHTFHDIWENGLFDENGAFADQTCKIRSALEYVRLRKETNLTGNRYKVCTRLTIKYHARQGNVHELFNGAGENQWSGFLQGRHSDPEYKNALIKLAHWVRDQSPKPGENVLLQLFRHSAAIVRGRMEASLVSKECDVEHSDWYQCWKEHMEVAACWFVLMMAAWRRLNQLNPTEYPILNNEIFKEKMKEDRAPFRPNFYGREPEPAQLPANQA